MYWVGLGNGSRLRDNHRLQALEGVRVEEGRRGET